jgi:hypothetical protein
MAWNPSPKVADLRDLAKKWSKTEVIVFYIDGDEGTLEMVTYGQTPGLCALAKERGDVAYAALMEDANKRGTP